MSSDTVFKAHPPGKTLWRVTLDFKGMLTADKAEIFSDCLEDTALSVLLRNEEASDGDNWVIDLVCEQEPDKDNILFRLNAMAEAQDWDLSLAKPDIRLETLPDKDWLSHVHEAFPPLDIGRFFVYGSHYTGDIPAGKDGLLIDAATAFGSGEHGTTSGCLQALEALSQSYDVKWAVDQVFWPLVWQNSGHRPPSQPWILILNPCALPKTMPNLIISAQRKCHPQQAMDTKHLLSPITGLMT